MSNTVHTPQYAFAELLCNWLRDINQSLDGSKVLSCSVAWREAVLEKKCRPPLCNMTYSVLTVSRLPFVTNQIECKQTKAELFKFLDYVFLGPDCVSWCVRVNWA